MNDLAEQLAAFQVLFSQANARAHKAENKFYEFTYRVSADAERSAPISAPLDVWIITGPNNLMPGGMFFHRTNAIGYAVQVTGIKWCKLRRMGYRCERAAVVLK